MPDSIEGNLELKDLHFAYATRPDRMVLNGISLTLNRCVNKALQGYYMVCSSRLGCLDRKYWRQLSPFVAIESLPVQTLGLEITACCTPVCECGREVYICRRYNICAVEHLPFLTCTLMAIPLGILAIYICRF